MQWYWIAAICVAVYVVAGGIVTGIIVKKWGHMISDEETLLSLIAWPVTLIIMVTAGIARATVAVLDRMSGSRRGSRA